MGAQFTYDPDDGAWGMRFVWHGGAYIEVCGIDNHGRTLAAYEVINVWDYETDRPTIERTLDAFQQRCDEWLDEAQEEES